MKDVTAKSFKYGAYIGIGLGAMYFFELCSYALGFWYGSECVEDTANCPSSQNGGFPYSAGDVLIIFYSIWMAGFNLSQLTPSLKKIVEGKTAASRIYAIIDRQPAVISSPNAVRPS